jgi:hypothetical protein
MSDQYVFIVGMPKTGTKLVKNILENSTKNNFKITSEIHFLGHLVNLIRPGLRHEIQKIGSRFDDDTIKKFVAYLFQKGKSSPNYSYLLQLQSGHLKITKDDLIKRMIKSDRSDKEIYKILLTSHVKDNEKVIIGEKAPPNLWHVPKLIEWFPNAKIIHTFRDPRAILTSQWIKKTGSPVDYYLFKPSSPMYTFMIVLHITVAWLYAVFLHKKYQRLYPNNYFLIKFEDIINNPPYSIKKMCRFLEIEFDDQMLKPKQQGSSYRQKIATGFNVTTLNRWESYLQPWMKKWMTLFTKKYLKEFGYI